MTQPSPFSRIYSKKYKLIYQNFFFIHRNLVIANGVFSVVDTYLTVTVVWEKLLRHLPPRTKLNFHITGVTSGTPHAIVHS